MARLDECLKSFDESSSALKDAAQSFMGNMAAMAQPSPRRDLKDTFANNAFENYEIAATSRLAMCDAADAAACKSPLEANLHEEESMAKCIADNVANVTQMFLSRQERQAA